MVAARLFLSPFCILNTLSSSGPFVLAATLRRRLADTRHTPTEPRAEIYLGSGYLCVGRVLPGRVRTIAYLRSGNGYGRVAVEVSIGGTRMRLSFSRCSVGDAAVLYAPWDTYKLAVGST